MTLHELLSVETRGSQRLLLAERTRLFVAAGAGLLALQLLRRHVWQRAGIEPSVVNAWVTALSPRVVADWRFAKPKSSCFTPALVTRGA